MRIKGEIDFSTDKGKSIIGQNEVTVLGDAHFKAKALQFFGVNRGIEEGFDFINSVQLSMSGSTSIIAGVNDNLTIYLLNLPQAELDNLTKDSQILPIYTPGTYDIDSSKIVGWASIDRSSTQAKQGVLATRKPETVLDDWISSIAWTWEAGKATGTFNCIAIGYNVVNGGSSKYNGVSIHKGLESNDVLATEANPSGFMARNNIQGITGPNEILLGNAVTPQNARVKLDLVSKTKTELTPQDAAYDFPLSRADWPQVIIGDILYYFINSSSYLQKYDMTTGQHTQTSLSSSYKEILFTYNGYLYLSTTGSRYNAYNPTTLAAASTYNLNMADLKLPEDFKYGSNNSYNYKVANYGDTSSIIFVVNSTSPSNQRGIVMTDPKIDSIIKTVPMLSSAVNYNINNEVVYFGYHYQDEIYKTLQGLAVSSYSNFGVHGVKMCKYVGNMLSFKKYDIPQTIAADEVARVEYSYKYGE